jgi:hypothetical protein
MPSPAKEVLRRVRAAWWAIRDPMAYPPGHYYSPLLSRRTPNFGFGSDDLEGIDLSAEAQLDLVTRFAAHYADQFSSAVIVDTNDRFFNGQVDVTLIEPHPERLESVVGDVASTGATVLADRVQDVDPTVFEELGANDILFVDSSHVVKAGSDVQLILLHVLPRLQPGVVIHFHDVFYPFEYPRAWLERALSWNEAYMLRAFLAFNPEFEILLFNSYLGSHHREAVTEALPLWGRDPGSSIWLRRRMTAA